MNYLLIWDVDGTLIKMAGVGKKSLNKAFHDLYGIKDAFNRIDMAGNLDKVIMSEAFEFYNIDKYDMQDFHKRYAEILEIEVQKLDKDITCPGIPELLESISNIENIYNILGTGNIEQGARIKLSLNNLNRFFPIGTFSDSEKERWQLIEKGIKRAKIYFDVKFENDNIYIVGDTPRDIECGKKLGVKTIGVATGLYSCEQLKKSNADYVFDNLENTSEFLHLFA